MHYCVKIIKQCLQTLKHPGIIPDNAVDVALLPSAPQPNTLFRRRICHIEEEWMTRNQILSYIVLLFYLFYLFHRDWKQQFFAVAMRVSYFYQQTPE